MNPDFLDFEQPIAELEAKIDELRYVSSSDVDVNLGDEVERLEKKVKSLTRSIFSKLTSKQVSQLARHPKRPYTFDVIDRIFTDFQQSQKNFTCQSLLLLTPRVPILASVPKNVVRVKRLPEIYLKWLN